MAKQKTEKEMEILTITEQAAKKINELAIADKKEGYGLKVFVFPGGCSGFQYGMDFEKKASDSDMEINQHGIKVFLPKDSLGMIKGSRIDFVDSKERSGFKIDNPNAEESCGCGSSEGGCGCGSGSCGSNGGCNC